MNRKNKKKKQPYITFQVFNISETLQKIKQPMQRWKTF